MLTREEFIKDRARVFDKVYGALSGLASTGMHQMFKQWVDNGVKA